MKLNTIHGVLAVPQAHDFALGCFRNDFQFRGQGCATHDQGMVSSRLKWDRQPEEYAIPFVKDRRGFTMHQTIGSNDFSPINLPNALMPKADAQDGYSRSKM